MLSYCFLNFVFTDGENKVYELVKFSKEFPAEFTLEYLNEDGLRELYGKGEYTFDFKIRDGYLVWDGSQMSVTTRELGTMLERKSIRYKSGVETLYDLIRTLVKEGALLISQYHKNKIFAGEVPNALPTFKDLKISSSSMNMYFTVLTDDGFRTQSLVKVKDKRLQFIDFYFALPTERIQAIKSRFPLVEEKGSLEMFETKYTVFYLAGGMPIYTTMLPEFRICEPMLNYKIFCSERDKRALDLLNTFLEQALLSIASESEEEEEDNKAKITRPYDADSKLNVLFRLKAKNFTFDDRIKLIENVAQILLKVQQDNWDVPRIQSHMLQMNYNILQIFPAILLLKALSDSSATTSLDKIQNVRTLRKTVRESKLYTDLELFMYRAHIFTFDYKFPYNAQNYLLSGGTAPFNSEIVKKIREV